jgi:hypothetical protein
VTTISEIISLLSAALVVLIFSWVGLRIASELNPSNSRLENLGFGVLVGGATLALSTFGAVVLGLHYLWGPTLVTVVSVMTSLISRADKESRVLEFPTSVEWPVLLQSIGLGLIGMNSYSLWSLSVGLGILVMPATGLVTFKSRIRRRIQSVVVPLGAVVTGTLFVRSQPDWWHAHSNDAPFFESLSWTLVNFGADSHPGSLNGSSAGYHFLAYLWSGVVSELAGLAPFVALNVILPFLASFSIALICLSSMMRTSRSRATTFILAFSLVISVMESSFTSYMLGSWGVIAYAFAQVKYLSLPLANLGSPIWLRREILLTVLGTIAILGKGTALPIVLCLGVASSLSQGLTHSRCARGVRRLLPIHLLIVTMNALIWYAPARVVLTKAELSPITNIITMGLKDGLWTSRDILTIIPTFILLAVASLWGFRKVSDFAQRVISYFLCLFCVLVTASLFFFPEVNARNYIMAHALVACTVLIVALVVGYLPIPKNTLTQVGTGLTIVLATAVTTFDIFFLPDLLERLWATAPTRWIPLGLAIAKYPLVVLTTFAVYGLVFRVSTQVFRQVIITATLTIFVLSIGTWTSFNRFDNLNDRLKNPSDFQVPDTTASHPDEDTWEVGEWIRRYTPKNSVIATNSFCCRGSEWLDGALSEINAVDSNYQSLRNRESAYGGANFLLPAVAHRRFYLAGPRFGIGRTIDPSSLASALKYSVTFGVEADNESLTALREAKVNYFVLDKWILNNNPLQSFFSTNLFENHRYVLVSLDR